MECVDWCDAYEYCKGVGKRLCGKIGGGSIPFDSADNALASEWYAACTSNGKYTYPYGSGYVAAACNGDDPNGATKVVGSMEGCQSDDKDYKGVYDLSGNVAEWVDSCESTLTGSDGEKGRKCQRHGGSFGSPKEVDSTSQKGSLKCDAAPQAVPRNSSYTVVGFRCCKD